MNEDFWKALIGGMTPDKSSQANLWWQIPLAMAIVFTVVGITCK